MLVHFYLYNMQTPIDRIADTRNFLLDSIQDLSIEQLNTIPTGFNNNIIWNTGHLIAAQQGICYIRAGLPPVVDEQIITWFKNGSKPEQFFNDEQFADIKTLLSSSLQKLSEDVSTDHFANYPPWQTRYGVQVNSIEDAIAFLSFHEGLHMGYILALKGWYQNNYPNLLVVIALNNIS